MNHPNSECVIRIPNAFGIRAPTVSILKNNQNLKFNFQEVLEYYECEFIDLIALCPAVVCCRCSPEQKADVVKLIQNHTKKSVAAIGKFSNHLNTENLISEHLTFQKTFLPSFQMVWSYDKADYLNQEVELIT